MTTKQIAESVGKNERSVRRWIVKAADKMSGLSDKMSDAEKTKKSADYTLEETCAIIEAGMGANAAGVFRANAEHSRNHNGFSADSVAAIVRETLTAMVPAMIAAFRGMIPDKTAPALPAPQGMTYRDQLRKVMSAAGHASGDFRGVWKNLYSEFYYRYHRNIFTCARNRGMDTLDYVEEEGLLPDLLSLAVSLYGAAS
jgi:hypothetical protein